MIVTVNVDVYCYDRGFMNPFIDIFKVGGSSD